MLTEIAPPLPSWQYFTAFLIVKWFQQEDLARYHKGQKPASLQSSQGGVDNDKVHFLHVVLVGDHCQSPSLFQDQVAVQN